MFYVLQNESVAARRRVPILLTDAATGTTAQAGVALTAIYAYVNSNGGSFSGGAGTVANSGFGQYYYEFDPGEIGTLGLAGIHITAAACRDYDAIVQVAALDFYSASVGTSAYSIAQEVWNTDLVSFPSDTAGQNLYYTKNQVENNLDASISGVPTQVWNQDMPSYSSVNDSAGQYLYNLGTGTTGYPSGGSGLSAADVWSYVDRTITGGAVTSVTDPVFVSTDSMTGIASTVWNTNLTTYNDPDLAGGMQKSTYDTVSGYLDGNISGIPLGVWNQDMTPFIGLANSAGDYLYQLGIGATGYSAGGGISAADVWDFVITGFGQTGSAAEYSTQTLFTTGNIETYVQTQTPQDIWTYAGVEGRTITGGAVSSVLDPVTFSSSQYSAIASSVWNAGTRTITGGTADTVSNVTGNVSGSVGSVLGNVSGNVVGSVGSVTGNVSGSVGSVTGNVAGSVNSVTTPVSLATSSMTGIAGTVWNSLTSSFTTNGTFGYNVLRADTANKVGDVTLRSAGGINMVDADIHRIDNDVDAATYLKNILTGIGSTITGNIVGSVTSVVDPVTVSSASMTGIAGTVWSTDVSGYSSPSAGYDLANASAGGGISAYDVWNFDATGMSSPQQGAVLTDTLANTNQTLGDITSIPGNVWSHYISGYADPQEAGFNLYQLGIGATGYSAGAALTAGDVWSYATREITGGTITSVTNPVDVSASSRSSIAKTVWNQSSATYDTGGSNPIASLSIIQNQVAETEERVVGLGATVWEYATRTLTSGAGSAISAYDVWNFVLSDSNTAEVDLVQAAAGSGLTAGQIWSYADRTITGGIADTVSNVTGNVSGSVGSVLGNVSGNVVGSVGSVTGNVNGNVVGSVASVTGNVAGSVGSVTGNVSGNVVGSVGSVTGNVAGSVASVTGNISGNVIGSVGSVTGNVSGNVVGSVASVTGNVSGNVVGSVASVLGNVSGNVVGSVGSVTGNVAGSVASVTGNVSGSVASVTGNVAGSVASVTSPVTFSSAQYASIASSVWNAATRTLTSGAGSAISAYDVWNFVLSDANTAEVDLVQAASGAGLTAGQVWSYADRTITGGLADTVTSVTNPVTVGTNNDKTGYALSAGGVTAVQSGLSTLTQAQVGTEVDSSLSDVGLTSTVTGRIDVAVSSRLASSSYETPPTAASIASSVWSAGSRTITGGTVDNLTNPATVATSSMTGIAGTVWNYSTRTITAGGGATAGEVWTYPTRSLTSGAGITVNAATNIINGPYFVKSNVDGQDGNLDVITGMVQDIQLTVTDAFGNPFDTTALGLAVNFYNQAGTLTTSYGTSELYGPAGLVQFTLDTAVTGVEGRYNLILSAAGAGNTIKFGPLTTLVRPY